MAEDGAAGAGERASLSAQGCATGVDSVDDVGAGDHRSADGERRESSWEYARGFGDVALSSAAEGGEAEEGSSSGEASTASTKQSDDIESAGDFDLGGSSVSVTERVFSAVLDSAGAPMNR